MSDFTVEDKFYFLEQYTKTVANEELNSLIVCGGPGIGKTYIITETVEKILGDNYTMISGFSTARAMYDHLYHNRNKLVIFDDCDSVLEDKVAVNILKGALDSYDTRTISWLSKTKGATEIPNQFDFEGQIIFISNLNLSDMDDAIKSRALTLDLMMSYEDKIERIRGIITDLQPSFPIWIKLAVFNLLVENAVNEEQVNLRTYNKLVVMAKNCNDEGGDYERLVKFNLATTG